MKNYDLAVESKIKGIYLSSETIDLINITKCKNIKDVISYVSNCEQISSAEKIINVIKKMNFEDAKRYVFEKYKESMISTKKKVEDKFNSLRATLKHIGITDAEKYVEIINKNGVEGLKKSILKDFPNQYEKFAKSSNRFISSERDQIKEVSYDEIVNVSETLKEHNTILIGDAKYGSITNKLIDEKIGRYDFYHVDRDLEFCKSNKLHARYHTLLDKQTLDESLAGTTKKEILNNLLNYVSENIDYINKYNYNNKIKDDDGQDRGVISSVDLFNEIVSFNPPYENRWKEKYGIEISDLTEIFNYALENKPEGVTYVYNEPFLENTQRREKVFEVLNEIQEISPGLIDTMGSQMHITTNQDIGEIKVCFGDFKKLQEIGFNIQITEFDMCVPENEIFENGGKISQKQILDKQKKMKEISKIICESGVKLEGITYWSINDTLDHNLERTNTKTYSFNSFYEQYNMMKDGKITLEELLEHPYLSENECKKFETEYKQGNIEMINSALEKRKRAIIKSRLSGKYSKQEAVEKSENSFSKNMKGMTYSIDEQVEKMEKKIGDEIESGELFKDEQKNGKNERVEKGEGDVVM